MPSFKIIGLLVLKRSRFFKVFTLYGRAGRLGHVILTIYIKALWVLKKIIFKNVLTIFGHVTKTIFTIYFVPFPQEDPRKILV